jgi:hypothetical protein
VREGFMPSIMPQSGNKQEDPLSVIDFKGEGEYGNLPFIN